MSQVDGLIAEVAGSGVVHASLGDVGEFIRGNGLQKSDLAPEGFPAVHYGQIHTLYGIWTATTKSFTDPRKAAKLRRARPGDLLIATTSEDDAAVAKATAWVGDGEVAVSGDAYILRHSLDPKFASYLFQSQQFHEQKKRFITGTKVRRISGEALAKIRIPVPHLAVQREIVRILDQFTNLDLELSLELKARKRQYEHYKTILLSVPEGTRYGVVGDYCKVFTGAPFKSQYFNEVQVGLPLVRIRDINTGFSGTYYSGPFDDKYLVHNRDILIGMDGDFKIIRWSHGESVLNQRVARLQDFDANIDSDFVFYVVREAISKIQQTTQASTVKHLSTKQLAAITIPLLSIEDQRRRSHALNQFDGIVSDRSVGLPAELAARRKQYEYYRDRLLTFEEVSK